MKIDVRESSVLLKKLKYSWSNENKGERGTDDVGKLGKNCRTLRSLRRILYFNIGSKERSAVWGDIIATCIFNWALWLWRREWIAMEPE